MKLFTLIIPLSIILLCCNINIEFVGSDDEDEHLTDETLISAEEEIRLKAYYAAEYYLADGMEYELGGNDEIEIPTYTRGIDCSGLVVNCYSYAVEGSDYSLPFSDASANDFYKYYTTDVDSPEEGDLIIWLDSGGSAYHIALYEKTEDGYYWFIESNLYDDVDGINYRALSVNTSYTIVIKRLQLSS